MDVTAVVVVEEDEDSGTIMVWMGKRAWSMVAWEEGRKK